MLSLNLQAHCWLPLSFCLFSSSRQGFLCNVYCKKDFPVSQMIKNLPAMQETRVQSLSQKDSLEKGMAIHSNILAWRIPWTEEPGRLQSLVLQRVRYNWVTKPVSYIKRCLIFYPHESTLDHLSLWFRVSHKVCKYSFANKLKIYKHYNIWFSNNAEI